MKSRKAIDHLLTELAADMPAMLGDRNTFPREFEDRAMQILSETAPEDEDYVQALLDAYVQRSGFNADHPA